MAAVGNRKGGSRLVTTGTKLADKNVIFLNPLTVVYRLEIHDHPRRDAWCSTAVLFLFLFSYLLCRWAYSPCQILAHLLVL